MNTEITEELFLEEEVISEEKGSMEVNEPDMDGKLLRIMLNQVY